MRVDAPFAPQDYHLHSDFSIDGHLMLSELCERMIALGVPEICVTDHVDLLPHDPDSGYFRPGEYFAALACCRERFAGRLIVKAGMEIGEPHRSPDEVTRLTTAYPLDFVIGSLHWVGSRQSMEARYFEGWSGRDAFAAYFAELLPMVQHGDFDVVGHLDVPKRYGFELCGPFDPNPHAEAIRAALRVVIEHGKGIEINTGSARRGQGEPSPGLTILRWYKELGGEILTIGSDGHRSEHLGYRLDLAVDLARAAGFTHLTSFNRREPSFVALK